MYYAGKEENKVELVKDSCRVVDWGYVRGFFSRYFFFFFVDFAMILVSYTEKLE